jgi:HEXXH motif-containing protein
VVVGDHLPRYTSPWKKVPRPLTGVLHAVYSYLRVALYYRRLLALSPGLPALADGARRLPGIVEQLRWGVRILQEARSLTPFGRDLVRALAEAVAGLEAARG